MQFVVNGKTFDKIEDAEKYEEELLEKQQAKVKEINAKADALKGVVSVATVDADGDKVVFFIFDDTENKDKLLQAYIYDRLGIPCTIINGEYIQLYEIAKMTAKMKSDAIKGLVSYLDGFGEPADLIKNSEIECYISDSMKEKLVEILGGTEKVKTLNDLCGGCSNCYESKLADAIEEYLDGKKDEVDAKLDEVCDGVADSMLKFFENILG